MKESEDQLEFVKTALNATPRNEWEAIACAAGVSRRTLNNIVNGEKIPSYVTVFRMYNIFKMRKPSRKETVK